MKLRRMRLMLVRSARAGGITLPASDKAWRALSLCWKRATSRPTAPRPPRIARHLHQAFHTQVHLHLAEIRRASADRAGETLIRTHAPHAPLLRSATVIRADLRQLNVRHDMTHHLRERIRFETLSAIERVPVLAAPLLLPSTRSRRPAASALSATSLARHTHAGAMAGAPKSIARAAPVTAFASATPGAASRATPLVNTRLHDCPIRGDTLVWLKSAAPRALAETAANVAVAAGASVTAVPANTARPAAITSAAQMQAEVQKFARDAQRAFLLDPTLSERLADDVLRRVDKRLRIERERRGL